MKNLLKKKCIPCEGGAMPLRVEEAQEYLKELPDWILDSKGKKISKEFKFQDFVGAMDFVGKIADIAEKEGHHPDIHVFYNKVLLELSTHAIGGLSENDFIIAAKIDVSK